jgi:hypothetical protein
VELVLLERGDSSTRTWRLALFPYDLRKECGKGRIKALAEFDREPYEGSVVNMGLRNKDGTHNWHKKRYTAEDK